MFVICRGCQLHWLNWIFRGTEIRKEPKTWRIQVIHTNGTLLMQQKIGEINNRLSTNGVNRVLCLSDGKNVTAVGALKYDFLTVKAKIMEFYEKENELLLSKIRYEQVSWHRKSQRFPEDTLCELVSSARLVKKPFEEIFTLLRDKTNFLPFSKQQTNQHRDTGLPNQLTAEIRIFIRKKERKCFKGI